MKTIIFIAVIAFAAAEPDFHNFFEDFDVDYILNDDQELDDFVDCVLEKSPCQKLYESYKDFFSAAVKEKCQKCTHYQKHSFWSFIQKMISYSPENFIRFTIKYDPENKYFDALMDDLEHEEH